MGLGSGPSGNSGRGATADQGHSAGGGIGAGGSGNAGGNRGGSGSKSTGGVLDFTNGAGRLTSEFDADVFFGDKDRPLSPAEKAAGKFAGFVSSGLFGPLGGIIGSKLSNSFMRQSTEPTGFGSEVFGGTRTEPGDMAGGNRINSDLLNQIALGRQSIGSGQGSNVALSNAQLAIERALGFQQVGAEGAAQQLEQGRESALADIQPFQEGGTNAFNEQLAFLGLSGPEAEKAALQGFTQSPGARFAQDEEEQAIVRNALALGDAGGGRVKDELARRAQGRFATRLDTRLNQLGQVAGQGQQAASGAANIEQNTAANLSNLLLGTGENQASAVLGQQAAAASAQSEANRISALKAQQDSQQDADFKSQLFGLGTTIARPLINSFF